MAWFKIFTGMRIGAGALLRFMAKHYYLIILIVVLMPTIIGSVKVAVETQNPSYPFLQLGMVLANADKVIYDDVQILKENPSELIGMEKPDKGIWKNITYYWKLFWNVVFKELGLIWAIAFPFVIFYKIFRIQGSKGLQSSISADLMKSIVYGLIFIFVINLVLAIHGLATESIIYDFPLETGIYQKTWLIILTTLPFHGLVSLVQYLVTSL